MKLAALIRRGGLPAAATATPATVATVPPSTIPSVARVATVAVATGQIPANESSVSEAERVELVALVNRVADAHAFTPEDRQVAMKTALGDAQVALECFRELSARLRTARPAYMPYDDRVRCSTCANMRGGYCGVEHYSPVPDIPRRCATYKSKGH